MSKRKHKWGYCRNCIKNVPHVRHIKSKILRTVDLASFHLMSLFGVGPWYCEQCDRKVLLLIPTRFDAADFRTAESYFEDEQNDESQNGIESAGNFLKTDESLVMRSTRLQRFSEKYRDALVRRILEGSTTISCLRQEKDLTEAEILDWIGDRFRRLERRITLLAESRSNSLGIEHKSESNSKPASNFGHSLDHTEFDASIDGTVVEGKVRPK